MAVSQAIFKIENNCMNKSYITILKQMFPFEKM